MLGQNNEYLLNINRSLVVQNLQRNKVTTRSQLSKTLGLTPPSITKIVNELIEKNLVEETGYLAGEKGRRSVGIKLKGEHRLIGVKLSRRNFSVGVFDFNAEIFDHYSEKFDNEPLAVILPRIQKKVEAYIAQYPNAVAVGMAVPGPYLEKESRIAMVTETQGWAEVNLQTEFAEKFSLPVIIKHDANSGALAQWWFGKHQNLREETLVHFLVGEGVGAGVIVDGEIRSGDNGVAGEIGHVSIDVTGSRCDCGNYGCLELYCSSISFVKHAKSMLPKYPGSMLNQYSGLRAGNIFEAARSGDELALRLTQEAGTYIGYGLVTLINAYDPSIIVISDEMTGGGEIILQEAQAVVQARVTAHLASRVKIQLSEFSHEPILYGAAAIAIDYCLKNPLRIPDIEQ